MIFNKKAFMYTYLISVITIVISFFLLINFLGSSSNFLSDELSDNACRSVLYAKSNVLIKAGEAVNSALTEKKLFDEINYNCREDYIEDAKSSSKEEVFQETSELMQRCWYRYGEGEIDFMQNIDTNGNWCFTCAKLEFEEDTGTYPFLEFAQWSLEESNTIEVDGEQMRLGDYLQLKYSDIDTQTYLELEDVIEEMREDATDPAFQSLFYYMIYEKVYLTDLAKKEISTIEGDTNYIVFRYDRVKEDKTDILVNVGIGIVGGLVAEAAAEYVITWGFGAIVSIPKAVIKGVGSISKISSVEDKAKKAFKIIEASKKSTKSAKVLKLESISEVLKTGSKDEILSFSNDIKKFDEFKDYGRALDDIVKIMDDVNIDNFDDLAKLENLESLSKAKKIELTQKLNSMDKVNDKAQVKAINKERDLYSSDVDNFEDIRKRIQSIDDANPIFDKTLAEKLPGYFRKTASAAAGAAGAIAGAGFSNEYEQYVDVLNKEQYYRLCGPERFEN